MKLDQDWRGTGLVLLIINWMACLSLGGRIGLALWGSWYSSLRLLAFVPAILLTIAWKRRLKNPALVKPATLGLALAAFVGHTMTQAVPKIYISRLNDSLWFWLVPPLTYLGLAAAVLIMTFRSPAEVESEPGKDQLQRRWLKYLIWINFLSMALMSAWWVFVGVLVMAAATLAAWRSTPGRAALAWGLAVTQAAALSAWFFGRGIAGSEVALWFQIAISTFGLLLAVLTVPLVRALKDDAVLPHAAGPPEAPQTPPQSLRLRWGLTTVAGVIIGFSAVSLTYNYFLPDEMQVTPYTGPMKTVRMGWLAMKVPQDTPAPWISAKAIWPEGTVSMSDAIYDQSRAGSEQLAEQIDKALDTEMRERIRAMFMEATTEISKDLPFQLIQDEQEPAPNRPETRSAVVVDEHFQRPARLVTGGAVNEIELFIEMPEGYLKFDHDPLRRVSGGNQSSRTGSENEAWLIERVRELLDIYTWTGPDGSENTGFATNCGILKPKAEAGFNLHVYASFSSKAIGLDRLTLFSDSGRNALRNQIGLETQKKWRLKHALGRVAKGKFERVRFRHLKLAGLPGTEEAKLDRSSDQTSLIIKWYTASDPASWLDELEMYCLDLKDDKDAAARLGLWEAIASSVRRLDAPPTVTEDAGHN